MLVFSNWTFVHLMNNSPDRYQSLFQFICGRIRSLLLRINMSRFKNKNSWFTLPMMRRRWGESMATFSLLQYCLHERPRKRELFIGYLGLTNFFDEIGYVNHIRFNVTLRDFIFTELKEKSELAYDLETAKEITLARGEWVLLIEDYGHKQLHPFLVGVDYDESLLLWHIATEICFHDRKDEPLNKDYRIIAKTISDYMIYLLVMRPDAMAGVVSVGLTRFQDTCADAKRFFRSSKQELRKPGFQFRGINDPTMLQRACESILNVETVVKPVTLKGDESKSVLFDAAILAKELKALPRRNNRHQIEVDKWFIMSKVWVEMLSYAARGIRADTHAQQLSRGGDLITIVWLLMAHFGLGEEYQLTHDHERAKLVVGK
ncbi:hypothetical protein DCAR_0209135 [Daucus carota subsp. sativus]|nr:hypothetical protein DCAR_0209135 [Daucus carota subsp. sativus]